MSPFVDRHDSSSLVCFQFKFFKLRFSLLLATINFKFNLKKFLIYDLIRMSPRKALDLAVFLQSIFAVNYIALLLLIMVNKDMFVTLCWH